MECHFRAHWPASGAGCASSQCIRTACERSQTNEGWGDMRSQFIVATLVVALSAAAPSKAGCLCELLGIGGSCDSCGCGDSCEPGCGCEASCGCPSCGCGGCGSYCSCCPHYGGCTY